MQAPNKDGAFNVDDVEIRSIFSQDIKTESTQSMSLSDESDEDEPPVLKRQDEMDGNPVNDELPAAKRPRAIDRGDDADDEDDVGDVKPIVKSVSVMTTTLPLQTDDNEMTGQTTAQTGPINADTADNETTAQTGPTNADTPEGDQQMIKKEPNEDKENEMTGQTVRPSVSMTIRSASVLPLMPQIPAKQQPKSLRVSCVEQVSEKGTIAARGRGRGHTILIFKLIHG